MLSDPNQTQQKQPNNLDDQELPLMQELGIEPDKILKKFVMILTQRNFNTELSKEDDMAGTLLIIALFGTLLMLRGKIEFGNIYGFGLCGCFCICLLINLLTKKGVYV